jgi:DNA-binding GntR family transcriptional regulator
MKTDLRISSYNYIKDKILNNEYVSNQIISEKILSDELSVSKTSVNGNLFISGICEKHIEKTQINFF